MKISLISCGRVSFSRIAIGALLTTFLAAAALAQELHTTFSSGSQNSVIAGTNITYDFSVFNNTGSAATNATLEITLPTGITAVANDALCTGTTILSCGLGNILNGNVAGVNITLHVADDFVKDTGAGFLTFSAVATSDENPLANTAFGDTPVTELSDLRITNIAQETDMLAGDILIYTIFVDNFGPSTARLVTISDTLLSSDDLSIQSCAFSVSQGGGAIQQFTCTTGALVQTQFGTGIGTFGTNFLRPLQNVPDDPNTPGNEALILGRIRGAFRLVANNDLTITTDSRVLSLTPDPDVSNNVQLNVVNVESSADLSLEVDSSGELQPNGTAILPFDLLSGIAFPEAGLNTSNIAVTAGRRVKYTYTITNEGPSDSDNTEIISRLPAGVVVVPGSLAITLGDGTPAPGNCQFGTPGLASDEMSCGLGTIVPDPVFPVPPTPNVNNIRRIEFEVASGASLASGTVLVNNVLLGSSAVDEDNSNNLGSSLMVVSPITGVSGCSVGGPYTNVVCGNGSTVLGLNGFGFALPDSGSLDFQWTTTCPDAAFDDSTSATPQLSFTTADLNNAPVSCQVDLAVQNAFASSTCNGVINVVDCAADCFGVLDGPAELDRCGVCDGDGNSCLGCTPVDNSAELLSLSKGALSIRNATIKAAKLLSSEQASRKARRGAKRKFLTTLESITSIPNSGQSCTNSNFCVQTNNVGTLDAVSVGFDDAVSVLRGAVKKLRKESGNPVVGKQLIKKALAAQNAGQGVLVNVPLISSSCS